MYECVLYSAQSVVRPGPDGVDLRSVILCIKYCGPWVIFDLQINVIISHRCEHEDGPDNGRRIMYQVL